MNSNLKNKFNMLNLAVEINDLAGVEALLSKYPSHVNLALEDGRTPLHTAIAKNNIEMMKILLQHKASVNRDLSRRTETPSPLWLAMLQWHDHQAAELLIRWGADVNERCDTSLISGEARQYYDYDAQTTFLHVAVHRLDASLARLLMDHGADLSARNAKDRTVLFDALVAGCPADLVLEMLNRGTRHELTHADNMQRTYLHSVIGAGHEELTELLLAQPEVDTTLLHYTGKTMLHFAADARSESVSTARWLLERLVPLDARDRIFQNTPLHSTLRTGKSAMAKLLIERGADVNARNGDGLRPLHLAVTGRCNLDVLELLLAKGAELQQPTPSGQTALHLACNEGREEEIKTLLLRGADPLAKDDVGRTPFQMIKRQATGAACQMIRRLAALRLAEGMQIYEQDERLIERTPYMQEHYVACKRELQRMRNFKVYNDVTLFFIFAASDERLSMLIRNEEFLASFKSRYIEHQYHIYNDYISAKFERAEKKLRRICAVESHLCEIFSDHLTYAAIENLAKFVSVQDLPGCKL